MILITGATGLVGSHLALYLLENNERVRAIYRSPASIEKTKSLFKLYKKEFLFKNIEWVQADITDVPSLEVAFKDVEWVYHCAALISFDPKEEESLRKINIEGTANIVNFCLEYNIKKLCHVSSTATLGDLKEHETTVTEQTEWNPEKYHSDYALSKYGAEMEIWRGWQEGLQVVLINPGVILGPGFYEDGSGTIFKKVKRGLWFYTNGSTGFISVNDVVEIMVLLMKTDIKGERFIAISENLSLQKALTIIANSLQVKPPTIEAKQWLTTVYWKIDWIAHKLFFKKRRLSKSMASTLHVSNRISNEKIKLVLKYKFQNIEEYCNEIRHFLKF